MRINANVTNITSGTPVNLAVALGLLPSAPGANQHPIEAVRVDVQMGFGGTVGVGYYMDLANFAPGTVANKATAGHLTQQLQAGSATVPGLTFTDVAVGIGLGGGRDLTRIWLDVATTNSPVLVSVDLRD